jgi:peptidoglycan/LPS O-acetylase OafA/YrhL
LKIEQLTFTRFFAAVCIVIFHFVTNVSPLQFDTLQAFFSNANVFVNYFFILSGFVMVVAYGGAGLQRIGYTTYYLNRFARIYPLYILSLAAVVVITWHQSKIIDVVLQLTLLHAWVPGHAMKLNAPGWSLSAEAFFYLAFPVLFNHLYKRWSFKAVVAIIALFSISCLTPYLLKNSSFFKELPETSQDIIHYIPLGRFSEFLAGNILGLLFLKVPEKHFGNYDLLVLAAFIFICICLTNGIWTPFVSALFLVFILALSLTRGGVTQRVLSSKPLVFLGEISYGIYILQVPVSMAVHHFVKKLPISKTVELIIIVIFLMITSAATYYLIEQPIKQRIRNWYGTNKQKRMAGVAKSIDTSAM